MDRDSRSDAEVLKELAQRLLTYPHPEGPTSTELFIRSLPDAFRGVPTPPGSRPLGSALHSRYGRPTQIEAVYDAEGDLQTAVARCDGELTKSGWQVFQGFGVPGGFMPGGSWHSEATVETDQPVAEVESHFARQLERAGWKRVAGTADDIAAWSSWRLPGEGDWRGILLVLAAFNPDERFLYLRIASADSEDGGWHSSGVRAFRR